MSPGNRRAAWIWAQWRRHRAWLLVMAFFTGLSTVATLAYPLVLKHVIDAVTDALQRGGGGVGRGTLFVLAALLVVRMGAGLYPAVRAWMNMRFEWDIRDETFRRLLGKDYRFFLRFQTGDVVTRLTDDLREYPKLAWFLSSGIFRAVDAFGRFAFCLVAVIALEWRVALISLVPLPAGVYLYYVLRHRMHRAFDAQQKAVSRTNEALEATFSGIRIVKAFTAEEGQERTLAEILRSRAAVQYRVARLFALTWYGDAGIGRLCQGIALLSAAVFVVRGTLSIGGLYAIYLYLERLMQPLTELPGLPAVAKQAFVSMDRVEEIVSFPARPRAQPGHEVGAFENLQFHDVSFSYGASRPILDSVSFRVAAGEWVALVGEVGSGKSTILKLASGLLEPETGRVTVNGRDLKDARWSSFRRLIGWVPQEGGLFSATIEDNLRLGRGLGDDALRRALEAAQIQDELRRLGGMGVELGHRGSLVSGGQRQRLAIARALAGRPQLLILDDCTANLDAETERRFWEWMRHEERATAILMVSHRVATVEHADRVVVLRNGRIAAEGRHRVLMEMDPSYRRLLLGPGEASASASIDSLGVGA